MNALWVLVDGYSVLHAWPVLAGAKARARSFAHAGRCCWGCCSSMPTRAGDGSPWFSTGRAARASQWRRLPAGLEVLFSPKGKTADDVIERLVGQSPEPAPGF